jgi:hypothetical protein
MVGCWSGIMKESSRLCCSRIMKEWYVVAVESWERERERERERDCVVCVWGKHVIDALMCACVITMLFFSGFCFETFKVWLWELKLVFMSWVDGGSCQLAGCTIWTWRVNACVLMTYMLYHLDFDMGDSLVCWWFQSLVFFWEMHASSLDPIPAAACRRLKICNTI